MGIIIYEFMLKFSVGLLTERRCMPESAFEFENGPDFGVGSEYERSKTRYQAMTIYLTSLGRDDESNVI